MIMVLACIQFLINRNLFASHVSVHSNADKTSDEGLILHRTLVIPWSFLLGLEWASDIPGNFNILKQVF